MGKIQVSLNRAQLRQRLNADGKRVERVLVERIIDDCEPLVPMQDSNLRSTAFKNGPVEYNGHMAAQWDGPYAAYQYYGCWPDGMHAIKNHTTPGTTIMWVEAAKKKHHKSWAQLAQMVIEGKA